MRAEGPLGGWIVSGATLAGDHPELRLFAVAESDPADAVAAVERQVLASHELTFQIIGPLSARTAAALGLEPGEVFEMTA